MTMTRGDLPTPFFSGKLVRKPRPVQKPQGITIPSKKTTRKGGQRAED